MGIIDTTVVSWSTRKLSMTKEVIRYVITVNNKSNLLDQILFHTKNDQKK